MKSKTNKDNFLVEYELNLKEKVNCLWNELQFAKRPSRCKNLTTISTWINISPKKHLWINIKHYDQQLIVSSDYIFQLAKILKSLQKNPKLLEKDKLQELIKW